PEKPPRVADLYRPESPHLTGEDDRECQDIEDPSPEARSREGLKRTNLQRDQEQEHRDDLCRSLVERDSAHPADGRGRSRHRSERGLRSRPPKPRRKLRLCLRSIPPRSATSPSSVTAGRERRRSSRPCSSRPRRRTGSG